MRTSTKIGQKAAQSIYYSPEQAERIGYPLNIFVTINFAQTKCPQEYETKVFSKLRRDKYNKWVTRPTKIAGQAAAPTYAYAFENSRDGLAIHHANDNKEQNVHVHWLVHVPKHRLHEFEAELWKWVEELCGGILEANAINIQHENNANNRRKYMLKGTDAMWAPIYAAVAKPQGSIVGTVRASTSRNIGPKVRRATDKKLGIRRRVPRRPKV